MSIQSLDSRMDNVSNKISGMKEDLREKEIGKQTLENEKTRYETDIKLKSSEIEVLEKTSEFLKNMVDMRTAEAYDRIEETMNWCLSRVPLKQNYAIQINEFEDNRYGRGVALDLIDLDTKKIRTVKNQTGTAISQIVSFLLSAVIIAISDSSRIMVLDELFSGLDDRESIRNFSDILQALAENEGFQFHIVEQNRDIASNENINVIKLDLEENTRTRGLEIVTDRD